MNPKKSQKFDQQTFNVVDMLTSAEKGEKPLRDWVASPRLMNWRSGPSGADRNEPAKLALVFFVQRPRQALHMAPIFFGRTQRRD
jgi:hypothetical protein